MTRGYALGLAGGWRVEISTAALERLGGGARRVEIEPESELPPQSTVTVVPEERDGPNTPELRRTLCARAGGRCENPFCRREIGKDEGHGHHLRLRSHGGATEPWNEVWLCRRCHAIVHSGALVVGGDRLKGLKWTPRAADLTRRVRQELERRRALPQVRLVESSKFSRPPENSERFSALGRGGGEEIEDAIAALVELGWPPDFTPPSRQRNSCGFRTRFPPEGPRYHMTSMNF